MRRNNSKISTKSDSNKWLCSICLYAILVAFFQAPLNADIIYESATFSTEETGGTTISATQPGLASRFYIEEPVEVTAIGGHILTLDEDATYFGAIVPLSSPTDYPTGHPVDPGEVAESGVFQLSGSSERDYRMPLSTILEPGYYAVVLGTDCLGASGGYGTMPSEGQDYLPGNLGSMYYAVDNGHWNDLGLPIRFVVEGTVIPEPATVFLLGFGLVMLSPRQRRK